MYKQSDLHRKVGLEYEFLAIYTDTGLATDRIVMKDIWRSWSKQDHVELYTDYGTKQPVGVTYTQKDGKQVIINTDAGINVVEFGFLPFDTLSECEQNMKEILREFLVVASQYGVGLIDTGLQPKTPYSFPDLKSEKIWYRVVTLLDSFEQNHSLFHNIAAHQACVDVTQDEMVDVVNCLNALGGVLIALFANSGVGEWKLQKAHEMRELRWDTLVNGLGENYKRMEGIPLTPFKKIKDYIDYNFSVPMPGIFREKTLHTIYPLISIGDYFKNSKWETFDTGNVRPSTVEPRLADVNELNMYIWIQSRPKIFFDEKQPLQSFLDAYYADKVEDYAKQYLYKLYVETRCIASQPWNEIMCAPAFILGLIENIEAVKKIVDSKSWEYWIELRNKTIEKSMEVDEAVNFARDLVSIAEEGLKKRGIGEEKYLEPLNGRVERRESPAMRNRKEFEEKGIDMYIKNRIIHI